MKREVITYNAVEGFHRYPNAPEYCTYQSDRHRHIFEVRCRFEVYNDDREIEINRMQQEISRYFHSRYGTPCEFGGRSCEHIAGELLKAYPSMTSAEVLEDGYGGASLTR